MNTKAILGIVFVLIGCCLNSMFLEALVREEPGCGSLITSLTFLFVASYGFLWTMNFGRRKIMIPINNYILLAGMFVLVNELNNRAFAFKISMPLHIIFRSGGLIASMVLGMIVLSRRYSVQKYISVVAITLGTIMATLASSKDAMKSEGDSDDTDFQSWLLGIAILTFALFLQARMGIFQECLYAKHGKHPEEALFFFHALSLPMFVFAYQSIGDHLLIFNASEPLPEAAFIPFIGSLPKLWLYAMAYIATQFICINSVFVLTSECKSLTVMLVLTLRKFMSLLFSILYFNNPFTLMHWIGAILVFGGTVMFSEPTFGSKKESS